MLCGPSIQRSASETRPHNVHHYAEAVRFCVLVRDGANEELFRSLWSDEQHHSEDLGAWLRSLGSSPNPSRERATF